MLMFLLTVAAGKTRLSARVTARHSDDPPQRRASAPAATLPSPATITRDISTLQLPKQGASYRRNFHILQASLSYSCVEQNCVFMRTNPPKLYLTTFDRTNDVG